jgi:hypothetical protein
MLGLSERKQNQCHDILGCCDVADVLITLEYDIWCCMTKWLVHTILGQNAGFIFSGWEIQCKIKSSLDFLTYEDETNVPSWNVRHHSSSDTMPYHRKIDSNEFCRKSSFLEWDWSEWICKLRLWSSELWHPAFLLVVTIVLQSNVLCIIIVGKLR